MHNPKYTNKLAGTASPYLLQHQHNPVDWYPWGEEALEKARKENKPLIISIGYSACHWCHVMEKESFEDESIAQVMNDNFVCIKVDREEHPDVDHLYMTAVQMIHGNGGWPLNAFALPDGRPFYGGTYFKPNQWRALLENVSRLYSEDHESVAAQAKQIADGVEGFNAINLPQEDQLLKAESVDEIYQRFSETFDPQFGGTKGAPKFPIPLSWDFLLHYSHHSKDEAAADHLLLSLRSMASGGIYDHVGGGFARYSVDQEWHVPHFEKMLYDNAQLITLYSNAYQYSGKDEFRQIALQSISFLHRELRQDSGLYSSALDADSEGEEGKFYVWETGELMELLGSSFHSFSETFGIDDYSYWEGGKNVLRRKDLEPDKSLSDSLEILAKARESRIRPGLDDKVLCSWNALTVQALATAGHVFDDEELSQEARQLMRTILDSLIDEKGKLFHAWKEGKAYIPAYLEDYAFLIDALLSLHQYTLDETWLIRARQFVDEAIDLFYDERKALFWFSRKDDDKLVSRKMESMDSVTPSSNAAMVSNLLIAGRLLENDIYLEVAERALKNVLPAIEKYPTAHLAWAKALLMYHAPLITVFATGPGSISELKKQSTAFRPFVLLAANEGSSSLEHLKQRYKADSLRFYVCTNKECLPPVASPEELRLLLEEI